MKTVPLRIAHKLVLLETIVENVGETAHQQESLRTTIQTGIERKVHDAYMEAKEIISTLATDFSAEFEKLQPNSSPESVEMQVCLGFSAKAGVWVITAGSEATLKMTFKWQRK